MTKPIDEHLELEEDWPEIGAEAPEKTPAAPPAPERPKAPLPQKPVARAPIAAPRPLAPPPKAPAVTAPSKPAAPLAGPPKPLIIAAPQKPAAIAAPQKPAPKAAPPVVAAKPVAVAAPQKAAAIEAPAKVEPAKPASVPVPQKPRAALKAPPVAADPPKPTATLAARAPAPPTVDEAPRDAVVDHAAPEPDIAPVADSAAITDPWFDRSLPSRTSGKGRDRRAAPAVPQGLTSSLCVFWLGDRAFGLETGLVGEVVAVEAVTPVPLTPPSIVGIFNLRGTPVALVDLATVLDLSVPPPPERADKSMLAIVLREESILAAARVHRMDLVLPAGRGVFSQSRDPDEHPVVLGFLEVEGRESGPITVLDKQALVERLERIKLR